MNISNNVLRDLLPAYVAGEASAETIDLVRRALEGDEELRAEVERIGAVPAPTLTPPASLGMDTLKRTQRLLRRRATVAGFSVFFSTFPLALVDRPWGLAGRLGSTACLLVAAAGWVLLFRNAARLYTAGLQAPRSPHTMFAWYCATVVFSTSVLFNLQGWTGTDLGRWTIPILLFFWLPVYWLGRRLDQFRPPCDNQEVESLLSLARDRDSPR
jgi:hypothetical protein